MTFAMWRHSHQRGNGSTKREQKADNAKSLQKVSKQHIESSHYDGGRRVDVVRRQVACGRHCFSVLLP